MAYIKRTYKRTVGGREFALRNFRQTAEGFDADLYIDGIYCGPCTEKGYESNRMTKLADKELKSSKARMGYHGASKRVDLKLITLILSYEMADHGINMSIPEQREARGEEEILRKLAAERRQNVLLEIKNEELRHKVRSAHFKY